MVKTILYIRKLDKGYCTYCTLGAMTRKWGFSTVKIHLVGDNA